MTLARFNRKTHYWGAILCALPIFVVLVSGLLLMLKKQLDWVQPPTQKSMASAQQMLGDRAPTVFMSTWLQSVKKLAQLEVEGWKDVKKLDVRPAKGIVKVLANNGWEAQLDLVNGEVLQVAYRRSDWLEALHDGSWFSAKYWLFLPAAIVLFWLLVSGLYLFAVTELAKSRKRRRLSAKN